MRKPSVTGLPPAKINVDAPLFDVTLVKSASDSESAAPLVPRQAASIRSKYVRAELA
jgi:hypothetical protein